MTTDPRTTTVPSSTATGPVPTHADVLVVGGGLAGWVAALTAVETGPSARVVLVEARDEPGGRARSDHHDGFTVNQGAHALYLHGAGSPILRRLGLTWTGKLPRQGGVGWTRGGERMRVSSVKAIGGGAGVRAATRLLRPGRRLADAPGRSIGEWMDTHVPDAGRPLAETLLRTSSYSADVTRTDATAALAQLDRARRGVLYLDGGWTSLVDQLVSAAFGRVTTVTDRVEAVEPGEPHHTVRLRSGAELTAAAVVLANGGPAHAAGLVPDSARLRAWVDGAAPVQAACLDLALDPGARPSGPLYGLGEPTYLVDHARSALVAPRGGSVLHALLYEPATRPDLDPRAHLEALADLAAPAWREHLAHATFRQRMVVAHDRPQPGREGRDAPQPTVDDVPRLWVAGDWITAGGMLADAAIGSADAAGRAAVEAMAARTSDGVGVR